MRLTTAMLADSAQVQGGKLYVLGGGFETIRAKSLPVVHRNINLALIVEVGPEERHRDLDLVIDLIDEDGQPLGVQAKGRLRVGAQPALPPGASSLVPLVSPFYNVRFPEAKGYTFVVRHGDDELGRIRLRVVEVP
jgi:hypothetical protein